MVYVKILMCALIYTPSSPDLTSERITANVCLIILEGFQAFAVILCLRFERVLHCSFRFF